MDNPKNRLKQALLKKQKQIGLWSTLSSNYTVEVLAGAGFDWIVLDTEHSPADLENLLGQLQAIAPYPTSPVVRVPWNDMVNIKRVLDIGAQSLLIPQINTAQEARDAVSFTRYPPDGLRGVAGATRGTRFGRIKNYFKTAHEEFCVILQIESREALDNVEAIAAIDGVDGLVHRPGRFARFARLSRRTRARRRAADHREGDQADFEGRQIRGHSHRRNDGAALDRCRRDLRRHRLRCRHPGARRRGDGGKVQVTDRNAVKVCSRVTPLRPPSDRSIRATAPRSHIRSRSLHN